MQYFQPPAPYFVGDCMPFFHDGTFHLYYLLDENHHQGKGGLGGHEWAHASTRDLVRWEHHPLALAIEDDGEASICTGSVFHHDGTFYAYYATRRPDRTEHLSMAASSDGIHFTKLSPNPFASPLPPYRAGPFRDPCVFRDPAAGRFHMLATAELAEPLLPGRGGCLAHLTSADLRTWRQEAEPFLVPGYAGHQPECADLFEWRGLYYLIFSHLGVAHYRTAETPFGPWQRPVHDTFDGAEAIVMKTAAFTGDRRLGVAFLASPPPHSYAGSAVFRELIQHADGTLGTRFPPEMVRAHGEPVALQGVTLTPGISHRDRGLRLVAAEGIAVVALNAAPRDFRLTARVHAQPGTGSFELCFRGCGQYEDGVSLRFEPDRGRASWGKPGGADVSAFRGELLVAEERAAIYGVQGLDQPFALEVIVRDDIFDACIDGRRTLIHRALPGTPAASGDRLFLACQNGSVVFEDIEVTASPPGPLS